MNGLPFAHSDLNNPIYLAWREILRSSESWKEEQIERYQLNRVKYMIRYAYENTVGYRALYDLVGLSPDSLRSVDDLGRFPFIEKKILQERLEDFSVKMKNRNYVTTGGSTGIPVGIFRDPEAFAKELASKAYQYYRIGWKEGDRQIVFRGLPIDTEDHMVFVSEFNELRCSSYHLIPEQMEIYCRRAWEYQPEWLRCYPSSGYILARWLEEKGGRFPPIKGVLCASENLYDFQKKKLGDIFRARVFSHYGHYELAVLAGFCEYEDTYHVLPQYGYAELIDQNGKSVKEPGRIGEIVATSFIMYATPLIRYRTNDFAVLKSWECPACHRPYQIWERIEGRLQEFIITRRGRLISMTAVNFHDDIFDQISQFQFYQEEKGKVVFRYIPKATFNSLALQGIERKLGAKLGEDVDLSFEPVDKIVLTARGKHRFLIQKLPITFSDDSMKPVWEMEKK
jgi:phenylacetate-CoA ligase